MEYAHGSKHNDLRKGFTRAMHTYGEGKKDFEDLIHGELLRLIQKIEGLGSREFDFQELIQRSLENTVSILVSRNQF